MRRINFYGYKILAEGIFVTLLSRNTGIQFDELCGLQQIAVFLNRIIL